MSPLKDTRIDIYNLTGQLVYTDRNNIQIDVSSLSAGIYIVRAFDSENYYTTRLVIER
jgi:hypothetical protein